jgi:hypothetical protein
MAGVIMRMNDDPTAPRHRESRLQHWLAVHQIPSSRLESKLRERLQYRAPSRQQFLRWRRHGVDPRRKDMVRILWAAREVSRDANVKLEDLFDVDTGSDEIWEE